MALKFRKSKIGEIKEIFYKSSSTWTWGAIAGWIKIDVHPRNTRIWTKIIVDDYAPRLNGKTSWFHFHQMGWKNFSTGYKSKNLPIPLW